MRLFLAIKAFFKTLFDGEFAAALGRLDKKALPPGGSGEPGGQGEGESPAAPVPPVARVEIPRADAVTAASVLLSLLQREARLVDFIMEDIDSFGDAQVGAAARAVHEGCRKVFDEYVRLVPVQEGREGEEVEVPEGFDPSAVRLSGNVDGDPPFRGILRHHGWKIDSIDLPARPASVSAEVVAPADVEIH